MKFLNNPPPILLFYFIDKGELPYLLFTEKSEGKNSFPSLQK